ncbi:MAG: hypothetical protein ACRC0X_02270 [Brevinema sp.]
MINHQKNIEIIIADTERMFNTYKEFETKIAQTQMTVVKNNLTLEQAERIVAIMEYINIRTSNIAGYLKSSIQTEAEENKLILFSYKEDNKLKKQKKADESIPEILELCEAFGLDIPKDLIITCKPPQEERTVISTNKILENARDYLSQEQYLKLRDTMEENGYIVIEKDIRMKLEEDVLLKSDS